jgi:dethiobiotin synthetase
MTKIFFVAGTDTGVGKTRIACALSAYLSVTRKLDVGVMKPFEPGLGLQGKDSLPWDSISLKEASGSQDDLALINPYSFEANVSPDGAAELEHVWIDLENLDRLFERVRKTHEVTVVEGSGGVLTPLQRGFFVADLIKRWHLPVIVVSRLGVGTVNQTLLTCRFLKAENIEVTGVILNDLEGKHDTSAKTNPETLARYLDVPLLGIFPHRRHRGHPMDRESLARAFEKHIDVKRILD